MAEILKEWLTERLRRPIKWEAEEFGEMMKNGYIIASVLLSYNVINEEKHFLIRSSNAHEDINNNWQYLSDWLRELEVNLNDSDLISVKEGKGTALLRLFYQLFLHLDRRDRTNFIKRERKMVSNLVDKMKNRFKVENIPEEEESFVDNLSKPLLDEKQFIDWQRKKAEQVKDTYDYVRHKYSKMLKKIEDEHTPLHHEAAKSQQMPNNNKKEMDRFSLRYPCKFENYTYEELLELEKKTVERKKSITDSDWVKDYMDNLHSRMRKKSDSREFQKQVRNVLSGSLWDLSVTEEEGKLDKELAKKVMKLSQFEKQMCTKIMETKQQARNLIKNRVQAEREFADQREQQFNQYLDNVKEQINLEVSEIDFEKKRQNILHKRLYAEKMKRKRQHYYEICYETMLSIVDYATKYAYFKRLIGDSIPHHFIHEWKSLYYKRQPIFDILDPMENILKESALEEELVPEEEEIVRLELDRQDSLNDVEFQEYHDYCYPWTLDLLIPNYDPESEERKYEYLGTRILGHLVYTLLEIKYPYPPSRPPAELPPYTTKALLRGLPDRSITVAVQALLNLRKIFVIRLESAINFCLKKFKVELIGITDIELSFDKFSAAAQEEEDKEIIKLMKIEEETVSKSSEPNISQILGVIPSNCKQTQTPKSLPEEEMKLSSAAELGRYAYETLNFGDTLTDHLLAAMIVEYLKDQQDINGFVIVNYPNSYREAKILEETFSGRAPPDEGLLDDRDDIFLEESIVKHRKKETDPFKDIRVSKLVSDPHKKQVEKPFESYFSCYIRLNKTEDILQELVIWDLTEENSELIDRFYAILGINYSMYYEIVEKELLAQICKYIIGDYTMPIKSCDTLFGENVLSLLDFPSTDDKRTKSKIIKPEVSDGRSKEKVRRSSKSSKLSTTNELEVVKEPNSKDDVREDLLIIAEEADNEYQSKSTLSSEATKILPGEEEWDYGEIPIAETIGVALATCWEEIEKTYIRDMQQLFFGKRLQINSLVPYVRFIKEKMEQIITLPSHKQDIVSSFQNDYNDFENDWRNIHVTKNEWHFRIKDLQSKLYHICDERKLYAECQRQALICDNWAMDELTTMVNTYISCMQTELNRSMLTFQMFHDFYFAMIKHMPPTSGRLTSKDLTKIFVDSDETSGSKKGGEDKEYRQLKSAFQELQLKNIEIDFSNNPFNLVIENNVKFAFKVIKETNDLYRSLISREYGEIAKIVPSVKKKDENSSQESINLEEIFKTNALKCIEEWLMGINGEMYRSSLRMLTLQYKCYRDMKLFNDHIYKTFMEIQNDIDTYYMNEIKSVDRLCKYLQMAVENGKRIPESLVLEHDTFIIDPNLLQFAPLEGPSTSGEIKEMAMQFEFKIGQLARLRDQLKIIAPTGIALQQGFIYVLQDFIFFGKESCDGPFVPDGWKQVDPEQIPKLVFLIFGDTAYVDWRDFLIYCLNIRFPTVEELLELRKRFRCNDLKSSELIYRDDFINEEFWFEEDFDPDDKYSQLRKVLMKHFLFELFETSENKMNYSAFLLAFCKNLDPIEGFANALSMAVGKKTCFSLDECEDVVCKLIKEKQYKDAYLACALKCTNKFLDKLIAAVVTICEGTSIIELQYTEAEMSASKKPKKTKGPAQKSKKNESSQSARLPKSKSLSSRSKMAQSEIDVKMTYICKPCEDEAEAAEEKPQDKEDVEEEHKSDPQEDPNLAYAVSQVTIWTVLKICLPWHFVLIPEERETPYIQQVQDVMTRLESDTDNGDIYVCKFVRDPIICKLLHKVQKFTALNLFEEVRKICV